MDASFDVSLAEVPIIHNRAVHALKPMCNLLVWIALQIIILAMLEKMTRGYRDRTWFKVIFAPSALLEGLARLLACALSAKSVEGMYWFQDKKPVVQDGKSRIDYFGPVIYVIAWLGFVYLAFRFWAMNAGDVFDVYAMVLPHVDPAAIADGVIALDFRVYCDGFIAFWQGLGKSSWQAWLFLYVIAGTFPFQAVRYPHLKCGVLIIAAVGLLTFCVGYLGIGFLSRGWWLRWWILPDTFRVYSLFLTLLALTLIAHVGLRLAWQGIGQLAEKKPSGGGGAKKKSGKKKEKAYA